MWYRCNSLPGPDPGGTLAIDLKNGDDYSCCSGIRFVVSAVDDHACLSTSACVIVAKLAKFRVQAATCSDQRMPILLEGMDILVTVEAKPPDFSGNISAR